MYITKQQREKYEREAQKVRKPEPSRKQIMRELGRDLIDAQRNKDCK
jgi:hypothetical protein